MADPAKIERLQRALAAYEAGELPPLFDHHAEQTQAVIRSRALRLLDQRARSRYEIQQRLLRLEFDAAAIEAVLDDLERVGLLNDADFANEWVRQRFQRRGKSRMALNLELKNKGIASDLRAQALGQIEADDEQATAKQLAAKKARTIHTVEGRAEYDRQLRRILGVLARRGFPQSLAMTVAREALDQRIAEIAAAED